MRHVGGTELERALAQSELLKGFSPIDVERFQELATIVTAEAGSELFKSGDYAQHLYVALEGEVELHMSVPEWWGIDTPHRKVSTAKTGQVFGWSALVEPYVYSLTAVCVSDVSLARFEGSQLTDLSVRNPHIGYRLLSQVLKVVSGRFHTLAEAVMAQRAVQVSQAASRAHPAD